MWLSITQIYKSCTSRAVNASNSDKLYRIMDLFLNSKFVYLLWDAQMAISIYSTIAI